MFLISIIFFYIDFFRNRESLILIINGKERPLIGYHTSSFFVKHFNGCFLLWQLQQHVCSSWKGTPWRGAKVMDWRRPIIWRSGGGGGVFSSPSPFCWWPSVFASKLLVHESMKVVHDVWSFRGYWRCKLTKSISQLRHWWKVKTDTICRCLHLNCFVKYNPNPISGPTHNLTLIFLRIFNFCSLSLRIAWVEYSNSSYIPCYGQV